VAIAGYGAIDRSDVVPAVAAGREAKGRSQRLGPEQSTTGDEGSAGAHGPNQHGLETSQRRRQHFGRSANIDERLEDSRRLAATNNGHDGGRTGPVRGRSGGRAARGAQQRADGAAEGQGASALRAMPGGSGDEGSDP